MRTNWKHVHELTTDLAGVDLQALETLHDEGLREAVKATFDINAVPPDVLRQLAETSDKLMEALDGIEQLARVVLDRLREDDRDECGHRMTAEEVEQRKAAEEMAEQNRRWAEQSKHRPESR